MTLLWLPPAQSLKVSLSIHQEHSLGPKSLDQQQQWLCMTDGTVLKVHLPWMQAYTLWDPFPSVEFCLQQSM